MTYIDELKNAIERSSRSRKDISMAAVGHGGAIRNLDKQTDLRAATLEALCREVGLEFYVGPQRHAVPPDIALQLSLKEDCEIRDAVAAIVEIKQYRQQAIDAISDLGKVLEGELKAYRVDTAQHMLEVLREQTEANPEHLRSAPFHGVPFVTAMREAGSEAVELSLAPIGLSFRRADIVAEANWRHLISMIAPGSDQSSAGKHDLIAVDTMRAGTLKGETMLLDVSKRKFARDISFDYLTLGRDGLDVRHIEWGDDKWLYSSPTARSSFEQSRPRRRLGLGEWVIGRIAGTASSESLFTGHHKI